MSHWPEIMQIIEGGIKLNPTKVHNYSKLLAEKLENDGESKISKRILDIISQTQVSSIVKSSSFQSNFRLPMDQDSKLPVADIFPPEAFNNLTVIMNRDIQDTVNKFLEYHKESNRLVEAGLELPYTLLLYGPPGCGKTILAEYIANQVGLPLVLARLDSLVSSFLGNTSKNIRYLFEYAKDHPCVLFLDEFDALAKLRDDIHELGELKRVVNSLLQNIDTLGAGNILIAATNHEHMLDPAVWRRFTFNIKIDLPDEDSRKNLIALFLKDRFNNQYTIEVFSKLFRGLSGSTIQVICTQALREAILKKSEYPSLKDILESYFDYVKPFPQSDNPQLDKVVYLRNIDNDFFTFSLIGELFGRSRQWAQQLYKKGMTSHG